MRETVKRTLTKAVVWRVFAFVRGMIISYAFTKDLTVSLNISIAGTIVAFITYFIYERMWNKSLWGLEQE